MLGFSPMICEFQGWAQGGLGMLVLGAGLLFAIALMVYLRWTGAIPYVLGGALAMYYGVPVIESLFHWNQDCAVVRSQFAQEENYANNTRYCEDHLFSVDDQTGEDCSCNGESATPQCESYGAACQQELPGVETVNNYCSCALSNSTSSSTPSCLDYPSSHQSAYGNSILRDCTSAETTWSQAPYCTDAVSGGAKIPQDAEWIGPVPDTYAPVASNAYYTMQTQVDNTTGAPIVAKWYGDADDGSWYFLNGKQVAYNSPTTSWNTLEDVSTVIPPGVSTLDITVLNDDLGNPNTPNPSGVASELIANGGTVLTATNGSSWYQVSGPPTSPDPQPPTTTTDCYTQSCAG